jgi:hypothetical protein
MAIFFKPSDITTKTCTVNNRTRGGSAFAVCEDGEQVFIPPKVVDATDIDVGDMLQAYCIDNRRPEVDGEARYAVRWRAIRVIVTEKFAPTLAAPVTPAVALTIDPPAPAEISALELSKRCKEKLEEDRAWTASQLAKAVGVETQRVSNWLSVQHETGSIAAARLYAAGMQERASKSWYARDIDLLEELIDEVVLGD